MGTFSCRLLHDICAPSLTHTHSLFHLSPPTPVLWEIAERRLPYGDLRPIQVATGVLRGLRPPVHLPLPSTPLSSSHSDSSHMGTSTGFSHGYYDCRLIVSTLPCPAQMPSACPPFLVDLIQRCWADDPDTRPDFATIVDVLASPAAAAQARAFEAAAPSTRRSAMGSGRAALRGRGMHDVHQAA